MKISSRTIGVLAVFIATFSLLDANAQSLGPQVCNSANEPVGFMHGRLITDMSGNPVYEIVSGDSRMSTTRSTQVGRYGGSPIYTGAPQGDPGYILLDHSGIQVGTATNYGGQWKFYNLQRQLVFKTCY